MTSTNIYYVYAYIRSKDSATAKADTPYYIGKGKGNRAWGKHDNVPIPKDKSKIIILENKLFNEIAKEIEKWYISYYGRKDLKNGILANKTSGGDGFTEWSEYDRLKASNRHKNKIIVMNNETNQKTRIDKNEFDSKIFSLFKSGGFDNYNKTTKHTACAKHVITNEYLGRISLNDDRWKTGEIVGLMKNKSQTEEHKRKNSEGVKDNFWYYNPETNIEVRIKFPTNIPIGYIRGRSKKIKKS